MSQDEAINLVRVRSRCLSSGVLLHRRSNKVSGEKKWLVMHQTTQWRREACAIE